MAEVRTGRSIRASRAGLAGVVARQKWRARLGRTCDRCLRRR